MRSVIPQVLSMVKVGTIGFGGGSALIPLIEQELVRNRKVLSPRTFGQHIVVSSITPGALPTKLSGLAGLQTSGAGLALVLAIAVALPGTLMSLGMVAAIGYGGASLVRYVEFAAVGITVFIIALLVHYVTGEITKGGRLVAGAITVGAFLATGLPAAVELVGRLVGQHWDTGGWPRASAVQLIAFALVVIVAVSLLRGRSRANGPRAAPGDETAGVGRPAVRRSVILLSAVAILSVVVALLVGGPEAAAFLLLVLFSTVTSFGGGEAYVGVADGFFVAGGFVSSTAFYTQLVPIANATPGPILIKLASAIGFQVGADDGTATAWVLGLSAGLLATAACTLIAVLVLSVYQRAQHSAVVRNLGRFVLPVICGLLVTTSISMLNEVGEIAARADVPAAAVLWLTFPAIAAVTFARHRRLVHDVVLLLGCGAISLVALLIVTS